MGHWRVGEGVTGGWVGESLGGMGEWVIGGWVRESLEGAGGEEGEADGAHPDGLGQLELEDGRFVGGTTGTQQPAATATVGWVDLSEALNKLVKIFIHPFVRSLINKHIHLFKQPANCNKLTLIIYKL